MDVDPESCPACPTCCVYTCITHHRTSGPSPWHFKYSQSAVSLHLLAPILRPAVGESRVHLVVCTLTHVTSCFSVCPLRCWMQLVTSTCECSWTASPSSLTSHWKRLEERHGLCENTCSIIESPSHFSVYLNFLLATIIWGMTRHMYLKCYIIVLG